jgi:hypothetical protein
LQPTPFPGGNPERGTKKEGIMDKDFKQCLLRLLKNDSHVRLAIVEIMIDAYQRKTGGVGYPFDPTKLVVDIFIDALNRNSHGLRDFLSRDSESDPKRKPGYP